MDHCFSWTDNRLAVAYLFNRISVYMYELVCYNFAINRYKPCFLLLLFVLPFSDYLTSKFQVGTFFPHDLAIPALFLVLILNGLMGKWICLIYSKNDIPIAVYFLLCFLPLFYALVRDFTAQF